jgi:hypothetical protein
MKWHGKPPFLQSANYEEDDFYEYQPPRQPCDLGVLQTNVAEEARTRGFASPALAGFAFGYNEW